LPWPSLGLASIVQLDSEDTIFRQLPDAVRGADTCVLPQGAIPTPKIEATVFLIRDEENQCITTTTRSLTAR
jgi:hypothetical protein